MRGKDGCNNNLILLSSNVRNSGQFLVPTFSIGSRIGRGNIEVLSLLEFPFHKRIIFYLIHQRLEMITSIRDIDI